jgi:hypothetical protein
MRIGAGLALIAIGAILRFAISTVSTHGVAVHTIGDILMLVGVLGVVLAVAVSLPWGRNRPTVYRTEVPTDRVVYRTEVPPDEVPPTRAYPYEEDFRR